MLRKVREHRIIPSFQRPKNVRDKTGLLILNSLKVPLQIKTSRPQEDQVKHLLESFQLHDVTHLPLFFFTGSNESQYVMEEHATRLQQRRAEVTNQSFPFLNSFLFKLTFYYRFKRTLNVPKRQV